MASAGLEGVLLSLFFRWLLSLGRQGCGVGVGGFGESLSRPNNVFGFFFFSFSLFSYMMSLAPVLSFILTGNSLHHYSLRVSTVKRSVHPISTGL